VLLMDILGSMLAYLGCVTGIVAAMAMSCAVLLATPDRPAASKQTLAMVSKPIMPKTATAAKPTGNGAALATLVPPRSPAASVIAQTASTAADRQRPLVTRAHLRRLVREERAKRWAYQQDQDFESRFLSYAD
jgi:hypothetical protein